HARCGVTGICNPGIYLSSRKVSTFSRFRSLRHLDLDLLGADQISGSNAKTSGSDLLDRGASVGAKTLDLFTALTAVGLSMKSVHGNGKRLMSFLGDRPVGHGACLEAGHNGIH